MKTTSHHASKQTPYRIGLAIAVVVSAILIAGSFYSYVSYQKSLSATAVTIPSGSSMASLDLISPVGGTVNVGQYERVSWTSSNYAAPTVSINIIRKVGNSPARYELVRTVAFATKNDGDALWIPLPSDAGPDTFVQVGCAQSAQACHASAVTPASAPLAVLDTGAYDNTASVYEASFKAIEALYNK